MADEADSEEAGVFGRAGALPLSQVNEHSQLPKFARDATCERVGVKIPAAGVFWGSAQLWAIWQDGGAWCSSRQAQQLGQACRCGSHK